MNAIKTEKQYQIAWARIYELMNTARKNMATGDELKLLVLMVEKYEVGLDEEIVKALKKSEKSKRIKWDEAKKQIAAWK